MTDLDKDLTAVKIKYKGPCPYEKGHEAEGFMFCVGLFVGLLLIFATNAAQNSIWEKWAIKNGYASYNTQGYIQWVKP